MLSYRRVAFYRYDVSLDINTIGPCRIMSFAKRFKRLKLFLHVSTGKIIELGGEIYFPCFFLHFVHFFLFEEAYSQVNSLFFFHICFNSICEWAKAR